VVPNRRRKHEVEDGTTALDAINAGLRPSLGLTDVAMPGVSGTELSDRLEHHGLFNTALMSGRDRAVESTRFLRRPVSSWGRHRRARPGTQRTANEAGMVAQPFTAPTRS
jgi:CheY-like chemotaxis protein